MYIFMRRQFLLNDIFRFNNTIMSFLHFMIFVSTFQYGLNLEINIPYPPPDQTSHIDLVADIIYSYPDSSLILIISQKLVSSFTKAEIFNNWYGLTMFQFHHVSELDILRINEAFKRTNKPSVYLIFVTASESFDEIANMTRLIKQIDYKSLISIISSFANSAFDLLYNNNLYDMTLFQLNDDEVYLKSSLTKLMVNQPSRNY